EDGIRDLIVTGVQTCALPISPGRRRRRASPAIPGGASPLVFPVAGFPLGHPGDRGLEAAPAGLLPLRLSHPVDVVLLLRVAERQIGRASCRGRGWVSVVPVAP